MEFFRNRDVRQAVPALCCGSSGGHRGGVFCLPAGGASGLLTGAVFAAIPFCLHWRRTRDVQRLAEELDSFLHMETKGSSSGRGDMQMQHFRRGIWKCCGMRLRSCWSA